jgi:hypothetical protein
MTADSRPPTAKLLRVVEETLQPEHVSRGPATERRNTVWTVI